MGRQGFWDRLGLDEGGMPVHMPMAVTFDGQGPAEGADVHHVVCWCHTDNCLLDEALGEAFEAGVRSGMDAR